jgi:hypothetical protein
MPRGIDLQKEDQLLDVNRTQFYNLQGGEHLDLVRRVGKAIQSRFPEVGSGDLRQLFERDVDCCLSICSLTFFGCRVVIGIVKDASCKFESRVRGETNVAIDDRSALSMNILAEQEKGDCGEFRAPEVRGCTGTNLFVVEKELSDEGPDRGLGRCLYPTWSAFH